MQSPFRTHRDMIECLLVDLKKNYNMLYLKGVRRQRSDESSNLSTEDLRNIKFTVDLKLSEIIQQAVKLNRLIDEYNETTSKKIKLNETRIKYSDEVFGDEYWSYSNCLSTLHKIARFSKIASVYDKGMCDSIRRPFTVLGYEIKRIESEYQLSIMETKVKNIRL